MLTFAADNRNTLTIHRAQESVKTMPFTQAGLNSLARTGLIQLVDRIPEVPSTLGTT
jgi:hypothetical protein